METKKLIFFCPTEGGQYEPYTGIELTIKDFLLTDYPTVMNKQYNEIFNSTISSPSFEINGLKMHVLVFSDGTFIRLKELEGKIIEKHQDKHYAERLTKILNII